MQWSRDRPFGPLALLYRLALLDRLALFDRLNRARAARRYRAHGWTTRLHGELVLLATGTDLDAIEVPAGLGAAARLVRNGPVAVTATGRCIFLVRSGTPLVPELQRRLDVVRHGPGSWVAVAPSRLPEGPTRWVVPPGRTGWRLPASDDVQQLLVDALDTRPVTRPVVPRQLSTSRRA
jgi:hypothetical protein